MSPNQLLLDMAPDATLNILPLPIQREPLDDHRAPDNVAAAICGLSLRSNFAWSLSGNVIYASCQWGMIVALAKLGSSFMLGQFSLGLAIATPVLMFTNLHLRAVQATDSRGLYSFPEYLQLRSAMTLCAMAVIGGVVWLGDYGRETSTVILAVALAKGIETLSDIYYGLFQLNDRLDRTGKSMMFRGGFSVIALTLGMYLTRDIFWACVLLALVWLAALLLFDVRWGRCFVKQQNLKSFNSLREFDCETLRRRWSLMRLALPLGVVTTLVSVNLNVPRYFIEARMGMPQLGMFSAFAYATVAVTLVNDSLGHCAIPRMSRMYSRGYVTEFRTFLLRLLAIGCTLGLGGILVAQFMGARLIGLFYNAEYVGGAHIFVVLMLATGIHCAAGMLVSGIMAARYFSVQVPISILVVASTALACYYLVPISGLLGAAWAMVLGAVVRLILAGAVVTHLLVGQVSRVPGLPGQLAQIENWNPSV